MFFNKISQVSKLGLIYQFCGAKMYVPLRPLINDKNLVYVEKTFKKEGRQSKVKTYYYYILPLLVFMNNYFTSWSILNTGLFAITSVFGLFARLIIKIFCSGNVLAL